MKRLLSLLLVLIMAFGISTAFAEGAAELEMSDVPNMTAPGVLPIVAEPVQLTLAIPTSVRVLDYDDNFMTKMAEEDTGIDIVFQLLPATDTMMKIELMMNSGEQLPDILCAGFDQMTVQNYGTQGALVPLNDYYEKYAYFFKNQPRMTDENRQELLTRTTASDGNIYAFSSWTNGSGDLPHYNPFINRYWLDNLDLKAPITTDELYDVLVRFRDDDPNQNGQKDEIPLIGGVAWNGNMHEALISSFVYYNPDYMLNVEGGKVYAPFVTDAWQQAMIYQNKLVSEGLMSPLSFTMTAEEFQALIGGKSAKDQVVGVFSGMWITITPDGTNEAIYAYDYLPPLAGPDGVRYSANRTAAVYPYCTITVDCKTPEIAFRFLDYWCEERRSLITRYGEPGVHWMYEPDDPAAFEAMFPYRTSAGVQLDAPKLHAQVPGVANPWSADNNSIWNIHFACMLPMLTYQGGATETEPLNAWGEGEAKGDPFAHRDYIQSLQLQNIGMIPDEVYANVNFTVEELAQVSEIQTTLISYVKESIGLFATGAMNPETEWTGFVEQLNQMGLEQWLSVAQGAYDRMYGDK